MSPAATATWRVAGMTCAHCAAAVTSEFSALPGVRDVEVSLDAGEVRVTSDLPLDRHTVAAAVEQAGYRLA